MDEDKSCQVDKLVMSIEIMIQETRINQRILILAIALIGAGKEILEALHRI